MKRVPALKVGKMTCPDCAAVVPSHVKACRSCGHRFSDEQRAAQTAFEAKIKKWTPASAAFLLAIIAGVTTCAIHEANRPLTPEEAKLKAEQAQGTVETHAKGTAVAAVQLGLKNPASFELVAVSAMKGMIDKSTSGWLVGVTYRATNSFGAVVPGNALVTVDATGENPLSITDPDHPATAHRHRHGYN